MTTTETKTDLKKRILKSIPALLIIAVGLYIFWTNDTGEPLHDIVLLLATGIPCSLLAALYILAASQERG